MLECIGRIGIYLDGYDEDRFVNDKRTIDAVALNLLVIGECATQLSPGLKMQVPAPWTQIIGLRHRIAHGYFGLSWFRLWDTAVNHAPALREMILRWRGRG